MTTNEVNSIIRSARSKGVQAGIVNDDESAVWVGGPARRFHRGPAIVATRRYTDVSAAEKHIAFAAQQVF